jgi:thiamine biosynthesis lipoprotein
LFVVLVARRPVPPPAAQNTLELSGETMGTTWSVRIRGVDGSEGESLHALIQTRLQSIDHSMSTWKKDSEVSRFNDSDSVDPMKVGTELAVVLDGAFRAHRASHGAFDITVGPLVQAWGFGSEAHRTPPDAIRLEALREQVGMEALRWEGSTARLQKTEANRTLDLSAIAKGHAVDRVTEALLDAGHPHHLVEVGGEVRVGSRGPGSLWKVAIEEPDPEERAVREVLLLENRSLATSGDYRQFRLHGGKRVSHAIDPRTGRPVTNAVASVSVVAETAMMADAYATALMVMGAGEGRALAESEGLDVQWLMRREGGELSVEETPGFARHREGIAPASAP